MTSLFSPACKNCLCWLWQNGRVILGAPGGYYFQGKICYKCYVEEAVFQRMSPLEQGCLHCHSNIWKEGFCVKRALTEHLQCVMELFSLLQVRSSLHLLKTSWAVAARSLPSTQWAVKPKHSKDMTTTTCIWVRCDSCHWKQRPKKLHS